MRALTMVGQNESGETKFERPLVVGKRDVLILQYPENHYMSDEELDMIANAINEPREDRTAIIAVPDYLKIRVLRIDT